MLALVFAGVAVALIFPAVYWLTLQFSKVYRWHNTSGQTIRGTSLMMFLPTRIALKVPHLKHWGMYLLRFVPMPKLIITDTQTALRFMSKQHKYSRLKDFRMGCIFEKLLGSSVGTASGAVHKRMRGVFDSPYSADSVACMVDMMEEESERFIRDTLDNKQGGLVTIADLTGLTFNILMKYTYGRDISPSELEELTRLRDMTGDLIGHTFSNPLVILPFYKYLPTKTNRLLKEMFSRWKSFNDSFKTRFDEGKLKDTTTVIYKLQEHLKRDPEAVSEDEFLQTLEESSLANVDITCGALAWLLFHTALHTDEQTQMRQEVDKQMSGALDYSNLSEFGYVGNVIKESGRVRPVMVISTPEYVTCPMNIAGYTTPSKFEASVDNSALNSDPDVWTEPQVFNPHRYDNETPIMRRALCRFGIGTRRCLGYRVAEAFMKVFLIKLLSKCHVSLETKVMGDDDSVPIQEYGPFVYPLIEFRITER